MLSWIDQQFANHNHRALALYILAASLVTGILGGLVLSGPFAWLVPLLHAGSVFPIFVAGVRRAEVGRTVGWMLLWALALTVVTIGLVILAPERTAHCILNAESYWREMHTWAMTGVGAESDPSQFIPIHLRHFALFSVLSIVTGGALSLVFGAYLLDYMNYYVGMLILASGHHPMAYLMGWHVWAIVRVVGYITLGTSLAVFLWRRKEGISSNWQQVRKSFFLGVTLVILDIVLKALLAPWWQKVLAGLLA